MAEVKDVLKKRLEFLAKVRKDPKLYNDCITHYSSSKQGCIDFINDWGMTYDPRLEVANVPFILFPKQVELLGFIYDHYFERQSGLIEKTRDVGATWLCCGFACWLFIFHADRAIGFGSRKEEYVDKADDPKCIFEKLRYFIEKLPDIFRPIDWTSKKMLMVNHANRSTITGECGDSIGRGGRTSVYFIDEAAFLERAEKTEASLSANTDVKFHLSTPNGNGNVFYKKRHSNDPKDVFTFNWRDDPRKNDEWYARQKRELDPSILAQEVDIDYDASVDNTLVNALDVVRAMDEDPDELQDDRAPVTIGVDPARFGDDRTSILIRQGRVVHDYTEVQGKRTTEVAGLVIQIVAGLRFKPRAIFVDEGGLGAGVLDILWEHYADDETLEVVAVQFGAKSGITEAADKRSEIWLTMSKWFEGRVSIPNDANLKTDICSLQYSINSHGEYLLEKKEAAKKRGVKSPDNADALALTFAKNIMPIKVSLPVTDTRNSTTGY